MINDEIREITKRFVDALHPEKIILFGSYARNEEREDSDYDFFIVMPDDCNKSMTKVSQGAYMSLIGMKERKSVDVLSEKKSTFEDRSTCITIERAIKREGKVIYDRIKECA